MNKLFCVLLMVLCPFFVNAEKALSKELIQALGASIGGLQQLTKAHPGLEETFDKNMFSADKVKVLKTIKSLPIYPKIEAIISSAGFTSLDEYYDVSSRVMASMYAYQANKMPGGMSVDAISNMMKAQVDNFLALSVIGSPETIKSKLEAIVEDLGVDEFIFTNDLYEAKNRHRALEILMSVKE